MHNDVMRTSYWCVLQAFVKTAASYEELIDVLINCLVAIAGGKISEERWIAPGSTASENAVAMILRVIASLLL